MEEKIFDLKRVLPAVLTIAVGMLLVIMDTTIMNVALPIFRLADRFSTKKVFGIAILLFTIASFLVSSSTSIEQVILYRVLQGLTGGIVGPVGLPMSFRIIPVEKRGSMMGILGLPMLLAPTIGPALSGWLIKYYSWHTIFLINIPIGIISLGMIFLFLPSFESKHNAKIDLKGAILSPLAFPILIYVVATA